MSMPNVDYAMTFRRHLAHSSHKTDQNRCHVDIQSRRQYNLMRYIDAMGEFDENRAFPDSKFRYHGEEIEMTLCRNTRQSFRVSR